MTSSTHLAYIGIGANLGEARATVEYAIEQLRQFPSTQLQKASSLFVTAPIDSSGDDYFNAVAALRTALSPQDLLQQLQKLELACGRERPYRNAPRTLDLDLLLYDQQRIDESDLIVPHPRMHERAFVLIPLLQLDPFVDIPGKGPAHQFAPNVADQGIRKWTGS
ncbi:2-amino-4-hydroxy-6-hydroxymethyldihydropteridine diphosphokinase [Undibacterium cyanobacteriorum]|uniref:2-amino-4-hydroxy-6-hydroxymethyldihydropteridine pyrophosphokinase n=1 Tax=Undibacterium cyanobacteriorum TaxID=3073561 RepID=A0ABY9REF5_9BURK|nr:2-amino-4-hydroxy-6-hydroxymethyldihydropteridine diphosphokinase [Undibacterium sp. 20NA77.5]WMW79234.1 2-amino-4-hydroxy-6-hydroxymethyldihydropteridine diphosphokinase [Undibacterium sp. 20NA77.5]